VIENSYGQIELETESLGASEVMTIAGARSSMNRLAVGGLAADAVSLCPGRAAGRLMRARDFGAVVWGKLADTDQLLAQTRARQRLA
jgi:hypothetical protein